MGIFRNRKNAANHKRTRIYIVEDNALYARQLEFFLNNTFGNAVVVECFPVAEVIEVKLEHGHTPNIIILDHNLNDKYKDASSGLESARLIHSEHPEIRLILHTAYRPADTTEAAELSEIVDYIPKGGNAFQRLESIIREVINGKM